MSCDVCHGHPGCPCCSPEPHYVTCPLCNGKGYDYYNEDGDEISEDEYNALPSDCRGKDPCDECNGEGEIEYEYEPDYDDYNEYEYEPDYDRYDE